MVRRTGDPETYRLGKGHVRFFAGKENWLRNRLSELVEELLNRGYNLTYTEVPPLYGEIEWVPDRDALLVNLGRLAERFADKPKFYTYEREPVDPYFYRELIDEVEMST